MSVEELSSPSDSLLRLPNNDVADCILLLKKGVQVVYILGSVSLRKVAGTLSIHGHDLTDERWYTACSSGTNLVTLDCSSRCRIKRTNELLNQIVDDETRKAVKLKLKKNSDVGCIVFLKGNRLVSRMQYEDLFDISSITETHDVGMLDRELQNKTADLGFTLFFELPSACTPLIVSPSWNRIPGVIQSYAKRKDAAPPVVLICGGKNLGKSTFGRYLTNKLLNTEKYLYFLETDVGQTEFTPPGVVSLTKVDTPIFGPPFSHLKKPERAFFFGDVTPKDRPSTYIHLIYILYKYYTEYCREVPLVVNTCGWIKGMGVRILVDIIRIVQPSHVVRIDSDSQSMKNLPVLTEDFLLSEEGWTYEFDAKSSSWACPDICQIVAFENTEEMKKGFSLQANQLRSFSLLSYFGSHQSISSVTSVQEYILQHCPVHSIPLASIELCCVCDDVCSEDILNSIIGSVVGLVQKNKNAGLTDIIRRNSLPTDKNEFGDYVGLGIVRNIDKVKQLLYVITPEPLEALRTVHVLVKGRLEILDCLYKKQPYGNIPYVTSEFTYKHRGSGQKRVRYNLLRQRSPKSPKRKE